MWPLEFLAVRSAILATAWLLVLRSLENVAPVYWLKFCRIWQIIYVLIQGRFVFKMHQNCSWPPTHIQLLLLGQKIQRSEYIRPEIEVHVCETRVNPILRGTERIIVAACRWRHPRGRVKRCTPGVRPSFCPSFCLSIPCLRFSRNRKAVTPVRYVRNVGRKE